MAGETGLEPSAHGFGGQHLDFKKAQSKIKDFRFFYPPVYLRDLHLVYTPTVYGFLLNRYPFY